MTTTSILVRVQARGGKFLGPDIGYSYVTVRDVSSGAMLAEGVAAGDSGQNPTTTLGANDSNSAIFTSTKTGVVPTAEWLAANPGATANLLATFDLEAPALVEISAAGITNGIPNQQTTSVRMWIWPGAQLTTEPGLVLEMAGLNVQLLEPNPAQPPSGSTIGVKAWVTMMCGCKILDSGFWPSWEFDVNAWLVSADGISSDPVKLALDVIKNDQVASVYVGSVPMPDTSGEYQLIITASQPATSNAGGSALLLSLTAP